jgi:hypothetical protein
LARAVVTEAAAEDLASLIRTHSLPADTRDRVKRSLRHLERFPLVGAPLAGRWSDYRFVLGPWRWLVVVYVFDPDADEVAIVTMLDARSSTAATAG